MTTLTGLYRDLAAQTAEEDYPEERVITERLKLFIVARWRAPLDAILRKMEDHGGSSVKALSTDASEIVRLAVASAGESRRVRRQAKAGADAVSFEEFLALAESNPELKGALEVLSPKGRNTVDGKTRPSGEFSLDPAAVNLFRALTAGHPSGKPRPADDKTLLHVLVAKPEKFPSVVVLKLRFSESENYFGGRAFPLRAPDVWLDSTPTSSPRFPASPEDPDADFVPIFVPRVETVRVAAKSGLKI